jgi:hypothetical protein
VEEEGGGSHVEQQAVVSSHNWGKYKDHSVKANDAQSAHDFPDQDGKDARFFVGQKVNLVNPEKNSRLPPDSMGFDPNKRVSSPERKKLKELQGRRSEVWYPFTIGAEYCNRRGETQTGASRRQQVVWHRLIWKILCMRPAPLVNTCKTA